MNSIGPRCRCKRAPATGATGRFETVLSRTKLIDLVVFYANGAQGCIPTPRGLTSTLARRLLMHPCPPDAWAAGPEGGWCLKVSQGCEMERLRSPVPVHHGHDYLGGWWSRSSSWR